MKIVFMGTPEFAVPILRALHEKYEIVMVVSQPNRVRRKGVLLPTPVAQAAAELGLRVFQPQSVRDEVEAFLNIDADVMVTAAYGQYIPSQILKHFRYCLNVHGSLLPYHRGGAPIQRCLMNGDKKTGVCIMQMTRRLDAGRIYACREYEIQPQDNASSLFDRLSIMGRDLLLEVIEDIYTGKNEGVAQDDTRATYSPNIMPQELELSCKSTTLDLIHQIQGLSYEPGAYLRVGDVKLKVLRAQAYVWDGQEEPGTVLITKNKIVIKTMDGAIELLEVVFPGKKMMSGRDFSLGQKIFVVGDILNS